MQREREREREREYFHLEQEVYISPLRVQGLLNNVFSPHMSGEGHWALYYYTFLRPASSVSS